MRNKLLILLAAVCCVCGIRAKAPLASTVAATPPQAAVSNENLILTIQQRDGVISVRSTPYGPTYSLRSSSGQAIGQYEPLTMFALEHPRQGRSIQSMQAAAGDLNASIWAGD